MWPTPHGFQAGNGPDGNEFSTAVKKWPTPRAEERQQHNSQDAGEALSLTVGLWATPNAMAGGSVSRGGDRVDEPLLAGQVNQWTTPTATDRANRGKRARKVKHTAGGEANLADDVENWPTPNARDHKESDLPSRNGGASLSHATETGEFSHSSRPAQAIQDGQASSETSHTLRRRLNPAFVMFLMGTPWWWTHPARISSAAEEMLSYRSALQSQLSNLLAGSSPVNQEVNPHEAAIGEAH